MIFIHTRRIRHRAGRFAAAGVILLFGAFILTSPDLCAALVTDGLRLCANALIPSLFPFLVLSSLMLSSGIAVRLGQLLDPAVRRLFHLPGEAGLVWLMGMLSGFPVGGRMAVSLYREGRLTAEEAQRLMAFACGAGPGFAVLFAGGTLMGSRTAGWCLYLSQLLSSLVLCFLLRSRKPPRRLPFRQAADAPPALSLLASAIGDSAAAMVTVCASVTFFALAAGVLAELMESFGLPSGAVSLVTALIEVTEGLRSWWGTLASPTLAMAMSGFTLGFAGLSVGMQLQQACAATALSLRRYFLHKALQGVLSAVFCAIFALGVDIF